MEIAQVEAFLAVGTFGGFRRAADALRVTQPAVSARIKGLEASLGVSLFQRGRGPLALSPAGRALRPHAEQLLQSVALARQAVHDLRPAAAGAVLGGLGRQALHAYLLSIEHPSQGTNLEFRSELPDDLLRLRHSLGAQGTAA